MIIDSVRTNEKKTKTCKEWRHLNFLACFLFVVQKKKKKKDKSSPKKQLPGTSKVKWFFYSIQYRHQHLFKAPKKCRKKSCSFIRFIQFRGAVKVKSITSAATQNNRARHTKDWVTLPVLYPPSPVLLWAPQSLYRAHLCRLWGAAVIAAPVFAGCRARNICIVYTIWTEGKCRKHSWSSRLFPSSSLVVVK